MSIKGCRCSRNVEDKEAILCFQCQLAFHQNCVRISKSAFKVISSMSNIKWYCDECMKLLPDVKSELEAIKSLIQKNVDKTERFDGTDLSTELCSLKNDLSKSLADAVRCEVKKNIELVNDEVRGTVRKWRIVKLKEHPAKRFLVKTFGAIVVKFYFSKVTIVVFATYRPGSSIPSSLFFDELSSV
ncbi:hypothetical protein HELRODRAFT_181288 [Helobdella robusta]|uniref:Zinc finger PHD-type domain-containing protein n=1 Tax=Helobdella robusta TaxID=6412 RepID=T1FGU7_HELRO|nr:hypothetical protein HELRODRAFT_181288 [Helobdella robusta]ESN93175.1 hypothetical protein HELRODRAFT_181288 [Helobdella robusta]